MERRRYRIRLGYRTPTGTPLTFAAEKYFSNCQKRGLNAKTIRKYRLAVDPFVQHCGATYVDECRDNKQPLLDYLAGLESSPSPSVSTATPSEPSPTRSVF